MAVGPYGGGVDETRPRRRLPRWTVMGLSVLIDLGGAAALHFYADGAVTRHPSP